MGLKAATTARTIIAVAPVSAPKRLKRRNPYASNSDTRKSSSHKPYDRAFANVDFTGDGHLGKSKIHPCTYARIDATNDDDNEAQAEGSGAGVDQEVGDASMEG